MTMDIYDGTNHDGLFNILGKAFKALKDLNTARGTTIPTDTAAILSQLGLYSGATAPAWLATVAGVPDGLAVWQQNSAFAAIRTACQNLVVQWAAESSPRDADSLTAALEYLIAQMRTAGLYVDPSTVGCSVTPGTNTGDAALCYSTARGDGLAIQSLLAESLAVTVANEGTAPVLTIAGEPVVWDRLSQDWPGGSGISYRLSAYSAASSLLSNGDFEDVSFLDANLPDGWLCVVGTPGTTVGLTAPEQQTITMSGSPSAGWYVLQWQNAAGITRATAALPFDASASAVQSALRAIPGLDAVTVTSSGTSPNYTHTVTFTGLGGNPAQLTSVNGTTGGTIAHATTVSGSTGSYNGRALKLTSNGSQLTALYQELPTLSTDTVYFLHFRARRANATASGALEVEIVSGIGGSVVNDSAGTANKLTVNLVTLSDSAHESKWFSVRIPAGISQPVYLRLRYSTAPDTGTITYLDDMAIVQGTQLYTGGPYVAAFGGAAETVAADTWTLAVTNNRGGEVQEWFARVFDMPGKGLLLPVSGSTNIPDTVIA